MTESCCHCGCAMQPGTSWRHYGTHVAHQESECLRLLQAQIARLGSALIDADHLASRAELLLAALNEVGEAKGSLENTIGELPCGAFEAATIRLDEAEESGSEAWRALQGAIHEYRKRAARARGGSES